MSDTEVPQVSVLPPPQPQVHPQQIADELQNISLAEPSTPTPGMSYIQRLVSAPILIKGSYAHHHAAPPATPSLPQSQERFREVSVKVHIRRPERDSWAYIGRGEVTHEAFGQGTRIGTFLLLLTCACLIFVSSRPCTFYAQGHCGVQRGARVNSTVV
jgi:hypothetical protein